jgi:hypothetical protein
MKKGKYISSQRGYLGALSDSIRLNFPKRSDPEIREELYSTLELIRDEQKRYCIWFQELEGIRERSRTRKYSSADYNWDKRNVIMYYTRWKREDLYFSRESLKRVRRYERKHDLEPFEKIIEKEKKKEEAIRLEERELKHSLIERLRNRPS